MEKSVRLTLAASPWCEEAATLLEGTLRGVPCFTVDDYRRELEANPDCLLYRAVTEEGALVGFIVLRIERYAGGAEGVLLAAAGRLPGANLYAQILPVLEQMFHGVKSYRVDSCRSAGVLELIRAGYLPTHFVMRKAAIPGHVAAGDDLLEELAACNLEAQGGPDLRARPGKLHKGGGSSSSSTQTTQNIDRRLVVGEGAVGFSSDGGTYEVNILDQGAIAGAKEAIFAALNLVQASDQETGKSVNTVLGFARDVFTAGLTVLDKAGSQIEKQTSLVSQAYDNAKGEGTQKNLVAAAALATVVVVAVKVWGK